MTKKEFADYLNEKLQYYDLSEVKLAKAVGIGQKTINRYRNEQTANIENWEKIINYFEKVAAKQVKVGEKYVSKPSFEELMSDDNYDPLDNIDVCPSARSLFCYTPGAQDFIIDHLHAYYEMNEKELTFIRKVRKLSKVSQDKLLAKLESIPVGMEMFMPDNVDEFGCNEEPDSPYSKAMEYIKVMRDLNYRPKNWMNNFNIETHKYNTVTRKETMGRLIYECEELYLRGEGIRSDLFDIVYETTNFAIRDWYFLFLFNRCIMSETYFKEIAVDINGKQYWVKENENMIWNYLFFLEK